MAEIRSTLDMVLERAAKMEEAATADLHGEEQEKKGMRLAAQFLRGELEELSSAFTDLPQKDHPHLQKGAVTALLRNIVLPREKDEHIELDKAMQGLMDISQDSSLSQVFAEMKSILERYIDHQDQLKQQLEEQFAQQMAMMEQNLAQQTGVQMKLEPAQHPKFAEEWQKILIELNEQYGRALDQYKEHIEQRLRV
ncbi:MAG: hypothetical protein KQH63_15610 [Desulfobulbaceae bacterium]|nr:hypothetical protein [Desulfobulbaceae bacterium]